MDDVRTPDCAVSIAGEDVAGRLRRALLELRVVGTTDRSTDTVELRLAGGDGGAPLAAPPTGRELRVRLGYRESGLVDQGAYWHTETDIECAPERVVVVRATGADLRPGSALKTPRTRAWHDTTLGAVAEAWPDPAANGHWITTRVTHSLASAGYTTEITASAG